MRKVGLFTSEGSPGYVGDGRNYNRKLAGAGIRPLLSLRIAAGKGCDGRVRDQGTKAKPGDKGRAAYEGIASHPNVDWEPAQSEEIRA